MARYIDADKSVGICYLSDWYQNSIDDTKPPIWTDEHIEELTNDFIVIPKDTPTTDVVEVKHGEWIVVGKTEHGKSILKCSHCKRVRKNHGRSSFCCDCGAKMDGTPKERGGEK